MSDLNYWLVFFSAAIALNISPGPDLIYILSRTIAQGTRVGLASAAGVCSGALFHVLAAAFGLSAILAASAMAFTVVKIAGAIYLLYLGVSALRSKGSLLTIEAAKENERITPGKAFYQGVLIDVLNPKVAIFFMAFLPQFVRPDHGNSSFQMIVLGLLVIGVAIIIETFFVLAAARTTHLLRRHPQVSVWLDRVLGTILISLGLRLALAEHRG